jgi:hypothetical protein
MPGWVVAALFLAVWLAAWAAGEVTVAKEVLDALADGGCVSSFGGAIERASLTSLEGKGHLARLTPSLSLSLSLRI